jgi:hypothetical protein
MPVVHPFISIHPFPAQSVYLINTGAEAGEGCKSAEVEGRIPEAEETDSLAEETDNLAGETGSLAGVDVEEADNQVEEPAAEGWASGPGTAEAGQLAYACPPSEPDSPA